MFVFLIILNIIKTNTFSTQVNGFLAGAPFMRLSGIQKLIIMTFIYYFVKS